MRQLRTSPKIWRGAAVVALHSETASCRPLRMGNSVSLRDFLSSSSSSRSSNRGSGSDNSSDSQDTLGGEPSSEKHIMDEKNSGGDRDRAVTFDEATPLVVTDSKYDGGRLWEVTPVQFDDKDKSILKIREFGTKNPPKTNGLRVRGLAPVGDPLNTNDEVDDVDYGKMNPFTSRKLQHGDNSSSNNIDPNDRVYVDARLPSVMVDMPTIYENKDGNTEEAKRKSKSRSSLLGSNASRDDDSATLSDYVAAERAEESRKILRMCLFALLILFLILLGAFLYFVLRDDDNDTRGIFDAPTVSPLLGRLFFVSSPGLLCRYCMIFDNFSYTLRSLSPSIFVGTQFRLCSP